MRYVQLGRTPAAGAGGWLKLYGKRHQIMKHLNFLYANDEQVCPRCGRETYRTGASYRFMLSPDQTPIGAAPGVDYEVSPIEYED